MDYGKIEYVCGGRSGSGGPNDKTLVLTLIGQGDEDVLLKHGITALRRRRIVRLTQEAASQGCVLSYNDLRALLSTSLATLKRDTAYLEKEGYGIAIRNRRGNGASGHDNGKGKNLHEGGGTTVHE